MGVVVELNIVTEVPEKLYTCRVEELENILGGPTIIHLKGEKKEALFLSTLLHANETTSFDVLKKILIEYREKQLPRDLIIFIGNVFAAKKNQRHLTGQADYNRIWEEGDLPENKMAMKVISYAKEYELFASIDIHNNTGKNPLYGCINSCGEEFLKLASHFGSHTVYFTEPHNVQSMAFSKFCTSITIEAGLPSIEPGISESFAFVKRILHLEKLNYFENRAQVDIYHTIARIMVNPDATIDFDDNKESQHDISFIKNIDENNFDLMAKNSHLGFVKSLSHFKVVDNKGKVITNDFLKIVNVNELQSNRVFIPSMFTKNIEVLKSDCLGYIMEIIVPVIK